MEGRLEELMDPSVGVTDAVLPEDGPVVGAADVEFGACGGASSIIVEGVAPLPALRAARLAPAPAITRSSGRYEIRGSAIFDPVKTNSIRGIMPAMMTV